MQPRDVSSLSDILSAAMLAVQFIERVDRKTFQTDLLVQSAVMRQIEIMGEATKRLSLEVRDAHPDIPWQKIAGMRDILIHAYDHVDIDELWNAVKISIPIVIKQIKPIVPEEK